MNRARTEPMYQGRVSRYALPNGWSFRLAFSLDGSRLRMEWLTGEYAGQVLDLEMAAGRVGRGMNFLKPV